MQAQTSIMSGALAGFTATLPMTLSMTLVHRLPQLRGKALPPEKVAKGVVNKLDLDKHLDGQEKAVFTWVSHYGFGAAAGALYPLLVPKPAEYALVKGIAFSLGVWAISYAGWIPAAGILRPPTQESKPYLLLEVLSHVVWGACLGLLTPRLRIRAS